MTPQTSYKFTNKTRSIITQEEIDNLPPPPQDWLDALYPKYDTLPTEIWNKIYDMKYDLDLKEHNENKCNFWEHDKNEDLPRQKVKDTLRLLTAKEYQAKSKRYLRPINEWKLIRMICDLEERKQFSIVCKKLQTQKRPRKETFIEFHRFMNIIKSYRHIPIEKIFEYNHIYLEDSTAEDIYNKENLTHWEKHEELASRCWTQTLTDTSIECVERKIDRLVSC